MASVDDILAKYSGRSDLIAVLEDIQETFGYVSEENMRRIEQRLKIPIVDIYGVVTFYAAFKLIPSGKHVIKVCSGTACHVRRSDLIHEYVSEKLGVKDKETTKDGLFTLESVNCLGACAYAPSMMIDEEVFGQLTKEKVDKVLAGYK
ncbi:MAG: NADH-quinone oxidoreductase subunit NuoE [Candidatus Altiarchaeota archaeon]